MGFVSTSAAVVSLTNLENPLHNNPLYGVFSQLHSSQKPNFSLHKCSGVFRLNNFPIKAMAEAVDTISSTVGSSGSSVSGSKQALISLSDKKDLALLGNGLQELGYKIVSTGGTASSLESNGVSVTKVEELTCFPEMATGWILLQSYTLLCSSSDPKLHKSYQFWYYMYNYITGQQMVVQKAMRADVVWMTSALVVPIN